jgi:hypothetical protein
LRRRTRASRIFFVFFQQNEHINPYFNFAFVI